MQFKGQPLTVDAIRRFLGTPTAQALVAASVDENLQFVRYLVDPRRAEELRQWKVVAFSSILIPSQGKGLMPGFLTQRRS